MTTPPPLEPAQLYQFCDPEQLPFETSDQLETGDPFAGQDRARDALGFASAVAGSRYNAYVTAADGTETRERVQTLLGTQARERSVPDDLCYVHGFDEPDHPAALRLPAGTGRAYRDDIRGLLEELRSTIPATFEGEEYQSRLREIQDEFNQRQQESFQEIQQEAESHDIALIQTPNGFTFAPRREGEVMDSETFQSLPEDKRREFERIVRGLQEKLQHTIQQMPRWRKEVQQRVRELNEEMAQFALGHLLEDLRSRYADYPAILRHLDGIREDVVRHVEAFMGESSGRREGQAQDALLGRYEVNLLVDHAEHQGAPVVYEDLPSYAHLLGRMEHQVQQGALISDFRLIRPGALHRANGGYLVLDLRKLLMQPFAWEGLKRALSSARLRIESPEQLYSLFSTVTLEPEPVPLDVKIVLLGDRLLPYLLAYYDPEFPELFKVQADFEDDLPREPDTVVLFARTMAGWAREAGLPPLDQAGMARLVEHASRLADDRERLSAHSRALTDLLQEAAYQARTQGREVIGADQVQAAIDARIHRSDRVRERMQRAMDRNILLVDTQGEARAQVNGLAVLQLGDFAFGRPSRITATARLGRGHMVDIEREAKLGGNIHSKGVMILSSFLAARYAPELPLSLHASLAFEQSYGTVDGDSASVAELCALLSALSGLPLRQSLAVTGSVNQHGQVQAVGGVNEKIEGFFDVCAARGLTGDQGVLLPAANTGHLMLRADVREAAQAGRFAIYAISTVDEALELLTGVPAGERDESGRFPADTVNARVEQRLRQLAELARASHQGEDEDERSSEAGDADA